MPMGIRALRARERSVKHAVWLAAAAAMLFAQPAASQGPMSPGGGAMVPQPRIAPPPPPPPPPVTMPVAPGGPAGAAPRSAIKSPDNDSPRPVDRLPTTATEGAGKTPDTPPPRPAPTTSGTGGGRAPPVAAPAAAPVIPSVDRSTALASTSRGLLPARDVAIVSTDGGGRSRVEVRTNDKGQFSFGPLSPGVRDLTLPFADLRRAQPDGAKRRLPSVTLSLVVPAAPGSGPRGNLVVHTYSRLDSGKDIRARISVPKDGGGAMVDWGDGTPPVNVVRDGWPINVGGGRGPVETVGTVSFVPKIQKFIQMNPCIPWWQCSPPPDPDPPLDDPWTEVVPEIDVLPPEDPIIEIVDIYDPPREDPPQVDPPQVDPPKIDEKGGFDIGSLRQGVREVRLTLPISDPPKPPVKVALLLPLEPRATVEAINAGGRPPRVSEQDRLHLVEHIYAPDTTAQTLRVRITMAADGRGALVDWGDSTPVTDVKRDGKPIAAASVDREAIGRILFLGAKKKQP